MNAKFPRSFAALAKRTGLEMISHSPFMRRDVQPRKIVFSAYSGKGYTCNPKYILEELIDRGVEADYVWISSGDYSFPDCVRVVRYGTVQALCEYATARIWVDNTRGEKCIKKKEGQFYIQTWHAYAGGVKKVERDAQRSLSPFYLKIAKRDGADTDVMLANNDFAEALYRHSFWFSGEVLRCGMPRNKLMFQDVRSLRNVVKDELGIPRENKICLYAPTFRKSLNTEYYRFDYERCCRALSQRFGGDYSFVLRLHPNLSWAERRLVGSSVISGTKYSDIQELIAVSDILISDYSSVADDFALMGRPGFLYTPDLDEYANQDRGFYFPLEKRPFSISTSENSLIEAIRTFDQEAFDNKRSDFFEFIGLDEDGRGAKVVADLIEGVLDNPYPSETVRRLAK